MATKTERIIFRASPQERAALVAIQRAYGLRNLSEAARTAINQVAKDRALVVPANCKGKGGGQHAQPSPNA